MYSERTTIVDVVIDEDDVVSLNMTAEELYNASKGGQVLRRHKSRHSDVNMRYYYAALAKATVNSNSYVFVFDNGEEYDGNGSEYPELVSNDGVLNLQVVTIPAPNGDEGKVLTVNEDDELEWSAGGSGGGVLVVTATVTETDGEPTTTLDKTWQEIHDVDFAVIKGTGMETVFVTYAEYEGVSGNYFVRASDGAIYTTESANGYPSYTGK